MCSPCRPASRTDQGREEGRRRHHHNQTLAGESRAGAPEPAGAQGAFQELGETCMGRCAPTSANRARQCRSRSGDFMRAGNVQRFASSTGRARARRLATTKKQKKIKTKKKYKKKQKTTRRAGERGGIYAGYPLGRGNYAGLDDGAWLITAVHGRKGARVRGDPTVSSEALS